MPVFYAILSVLFFLVVCPLLFLHPKLRRGIGPRLGFYPTDFLAGHRGPRIWLHGASAGDLLALLPIYRELRARRPEGVFVISTMTNSGEAIARSRFSDAEAFTFLPYDVPFATSRAVAAIRPDVLVLEYTEIWPNLIRSVKRAGGRVVMTNGRFSERNLGRYRTLFAVAGNPLQELDLLLMREEDEKDRALALGAPAERVQVTGNTKFDALLLSLGNGTATSLKEAFALGPDDRLWVAGSTHDGEEQLLLDVFLRLRDEVPRLRLVIAPRYLERISRVVALAQARGLETRLRSATPARPAPVVVLDSIGELVSAYHLAELVFVGGSFSSRGGQNILEPAACGKAVLFGPNMENFHDSVQVLVGRGGIQVRDADHFHGVARDLLARPDKLKELGALAKAAVGGVRGASERNAEAILGLLVPSPATVPDGVGS